MADAKSLRYQAQTLRTRAEDRRANAMAATRNASRFSEANDIQGSQQAQGEAARLEQEKIRQQTEQQINSLEQQKRSLRGE